MKIKTSPEIDVLIVQHNVAAKSLKKYNDYVSRNTKETKDHHIVFANYVTIRNSYRQLERALRIQLECFGVIYDGKGHYNFPVTAEQAIHNPENHEQKKDNGDND